MVDEDEPAAAASSAFDSVVGRVEAQLSRGRPSGPVEAPPAQIVADRVARESRGLRTGILIGVLGFAILVDVWLSIAMGRLAANVPEPSASRWVEVVATPAWRWGMLAMLGLLSGSAYMLTRRGKRWPLISATVTALIIVALTAYAVSYRVNELTRGDSGWTMYAPPSLDD
jgi:hypothetical protein